MNVCFFMREFDYEKLAERTWDKEVLNYIGLIHEYKELWNKKRVMSNLNWLTLNKFLYAESFVN